MSLDGGQPLDLPVGLTAFVNGYDTHLYLFIFFLPPDLYGLRFSSKSRLKAVLP